MKTDLNAIEATKILQDWMDELVAFDVTPEMKITKNSSSLYSEIKIRYSKDCYLELFSFRFIDDSMFMRGSAITIKIKTAQELKDKLLKITNSYLRTKELNAKS